MTDVAGSDATAEYMDVGHSEDADEILQGFLVGTVKDAQEYTKPKQIRVIQQNTASEGPARKKSPINFKVLSVTASLLGSALAVWLSPQSQARLAGAWTKLLGPRIARILTVCENTFRGGFGGGFMMGSLIFAAIGGVAAAQLSKITRIESDFTRYPSHVKSRRKPRPNPHLVEGFLRPKDYQSLPLVRKDQLSPNVFRFVFQLPGSQDVIGLPIGQHVAIKATVNGQSVSRSYTPVSNNLDLGRLELVIKCYPDGILTGQYLANVQVGDHVQFRGPKGAMKYVPGLCKKIGMIAGGTGITPMYQLIRAICEDDTDTTEVSLILANRTEEDILLRQELDYFARNYPKNLKVWYMLDHPPENWPYGKGYVTPDVMAQRLPGPAPDTKVMLCGPPGMVNAAKKGLIAAGFDSPSAAPKMTDQIFCF